MFRLQYAQAQYEDALKTLDAYVTNGGDGGMAGLERARTYKAIGLDSAATENYWAGLRLVGDDGRAEYRADFAWIASNEELFQFDSTAPGELASWAQRFWADRDALALRRAGERLAEHLRRWVYVHQKYLIYRPDDAPIHAGGQDPSDQMNLQESFGMINAMVLSDVSQLSPGLTEYKRVQWEIDDRGVIYLRHGAPSRSAIDPSSPPNESWQYDLPEGSRVFHFLGSRSLGTTAATTLVAALPLRQSLLDSRGSLDPRYSAMAADLERRAAQARSAVITNHIDTTGGWRLRPGSAAALVAASASAGNSSTFHPEVAYKDILLGRQAIASGVTTDGYPQVFKRELGAIIQVYGLGIASDERKRALLVFAIPGRNLTPLARPDSGAGVLYPVHIRLIAVDRTRSIERQLDTTRVFLARTQIDRDQHLTGWLEVPLPPGAYQVRVLIASNESAAATGAGRDSVAIPSSSDSLHISDLVLGSNTSGLSWSYRGERVALNPLDAYAKGADATLFYELVGLTPGRAYEVVTAIRNEAAKPGDKPDLQYTVRLDATEPYTNMQRALGLKNLKAGAYILEVTVRAVGTTGGLTKRRALNILTR